MGCEESKSSACRLLLFLLFSFLAASFSFPFLPFWLPLSCYTHLAGQEFASGLCGFAFFLFEFRLYLLKIAPELRFSNTSVAQSWETWQMNTR